MQLVNIGFNNLVNADRVIAVVSPESARSSALCKMAKQKEHSLTPPMAARP